jgi:hypothetical protein
MAIDEPPAAEPEDAQPVDLEPIPAAAHDMDVWPVLSPRLATWSFS